MGGDNQAQAHAQVVTKLVDFGLHVQAAGDALAYATPVRPWRSRAPSATTSAGELTRRGHAVTDGRGQMGGYQAVCVDPASGALLGGLDPRKDGLAIGW